MRSTRFLWQFDDAGHFGTTNLGPLDNIVGTEDDNFLGDTSGNDVVWGLGGNDTLLSTQGYDVLLGGSGDDEYLTSTASSVLIQDESGDDLAGLALANSDTGYTRLVVRDASGSEIADLNAQSDRATIEAADAAGARFEFVRWTSGAWTIQHAVEGVEHFQVTGSDTSDLLLARGSKGGAFDGRGGFDTFVANWSTAADDISWVNTPSLTQTVNGIQIAGMERLILRTGSGDDTIDNRGNGSSTDDLITGAGNDWVALDQGTVDTGSGDDTITQAWGSVDGGADSDMLHMGGVYNSDTGVTRLLAYDDSNTLVGDLAYTSSRSDIETALSSATQFDFVSWWSGAWRTQLHTANIEHWNVQGSNTSDLVIARGNGDTYAGNGGFDSFYADWSAASTDISWVNTPASTQTVNGISVSGFERLILRTGSGHDTIDNRGNGSSTDDLVTGAGNDWVAVDQGTVDTGSGDDTITQAWGSVDGGADSDTLHMGGIYNSDTGYSRLIAYDAANTLVGDLSYTSSRADIETALSSATQFDFVSWWSGAWRTQLHTANIEHWNVTGSATSDLIIARGEGSQYHGGGGFDTFYADWSASSTAISLGGTEAPTSVQWSGFERSLITGSAFNDLFDLSANSGSDDLLAGNGNDTIRGIGAGDTVSGGAGKDIYVLESAGAVLVEEAGGGKDEVHAAFDVTLTDQFEVLRLLGTADLHGTGTATRNILFGNDGANVLHGLGGNDRLVAGAGTDALFGDEGNDKLLGGSGNDTLRGGNGNDRLVGGGGDDLFQLEGTAAANGLDKVLDLQAGIGGDVVDLSAFFGAGGATALDGNPDGGTNLDALSLPQTLSGQHLFAVAGDFGTDGPNVKELAALLQGTHVDDGSHQAILVQDLLSGRGVLFLADERSGDTNTTLQAAELKAVAVLTLDGGLPSTALWAENFLLTASGG
ncbi:MAG: hypothetical protein J0M20_02935 [Burkholderiales bacterium]|nr:hypothetical protein [Burkholderiales bacterium]